MTDHPVARQFASATASVRETHTPGPWKLFPNGSVSTVKGNQAITGICNVSLMNERAPQNGYLIAAAPMLLEAIADTLEALELLRVGLRHTDPEAVKMIDAHIIELERAAAHATGAA